MARFGGMRPTKPTTPAEFEVLFGLLAGGVIVLGLFAIGVSLNLPREELAFRANVFEVGVATTTLGVMIGGFCWWVTWMWD